MSNVAELSKVGNLAALVAALEVVDIRKPSPLDQQAQADLADHPVDQAASEADSEVASTVEEDEVGSGEVSRTVESMEVGEEVVLATKVVEVSREVVMAEEIVVGLAAPMDTVRPLQMLPQVQVVHAEVASVALVEAGMEDLAPLIATALARQLVGMIRVVAVAHMMTDPVDIAVVAVEAMGIAMHHVVEVVATWSR